MKWYKEINSKWVEAPESIELDGNTLFNYNCDSNEVQLRADGYLPESELELILDEQLTARKQELLMKLVNAVVEVNSIKEAAREIVGSENVEFIQAVNQAEQIRQGSIYFINALDTIEKAMAFDIREHTIQDMKDLFIKFIIK